MSKKNISLIQKFLILIILVLICVILILLIVGKTQTKEAKKPNLNSSNHLLKENFLENQEAVFKPFEENLSQEREDKEEHFEANLSQKNALNNESLAIDRNLSEDLRELNFSKEQNQSLNLEQNLSKREAKQENLKLIIGQKPKLAIIIDDMANEEQTRSLKALNLKLNPSFFPSHALHPNTPKLAKEFEFYMVHLPLKALSFQNKMSVLSPEDSEEEIEKTIAKIKGEFKNLKFINNHTGSLFTSDEEAMRKLYKALDKYHLTFVDSKTIHNSKAPKIAKEMQKIYIKRDVFLDNEDDVDYVKNQLLNAVNLAQKRGYAIAIGHPKKNTFKALKESKELLKSVDLVYLSELYE
ncbi:divergent polysaccharide deacetylase family protein [Campylobacter upsaliensis]|uniref:divergent polysaccharide deacetylase family protein n=1 Tax=Campylobacter upsaliensis TaxID=28080 RepID=UPI0012CAE817|nr:divergent polysaccharide deacetylase family protein [Campylobacter upsaliensis]EAH5878810.1 divergent polysaccharide deacetylase family protein [Campylobacter upsaliensis]EAH5903295.1 divergent polysaccharide deacetylase family protein [Campylobacter upsaliensis]EAH8337419.1 divergent polysaccharide deacetylase family protein [Campylobacter upsaliensis]EAH9986678.1 divergent polysaccharide deacetylase family protein [Campylobacter upsaliensis]EAJ3732495.1 divergent polysaccharide deacetylas